MHRIQARLLVCVLAPLVVVAANCPGAAQPPLVVATFDAGPEDWGNCDSEGSNAIEWFESGGVAGGFIRTSESGDSETSYWCAPSEFLGDLSAAYGGSLRFQLRQANTGNQFHAADIIMVGAGIELRYETSGNPLQTWIAYDVPLRAGSSWRRNSLGGPPATDSEFLAVLADLQSLWIRSEFRSGSDVDDIDEIAIYGPQCAEISAQSGDVTASVGSGVTLCVLATGSDLSYAWSRDDVPLVDSGETHGAASSVLTLVNVAANDGGTYRCEVTSLCGAVKSAPIKVTVRCEADLDGNGIVDAADLAALLGAWGTCETGG